VIQGLSCNLLARAAAASTRVILTDLDCAGVIRNDVVKDKIVIEPLAICFTAAVECHTAVLLLDEPISSVIVPRIRRNTRPVAGDGAIHISATFKPILKQYFHSIDFLLGLN
jgi:hypothetical protein